MGEKFEVYSYGWNKATYLWMEIEKVSGSDSEGVILDSDNYEDKINHIEISHETTRQRNDALADAAQTISRSELWKLMWIARIARPGAIYDASAAALTFSAGKMIDISEGKEDCSENEENGDPQKESENDFGRIPGFLKIYTADDRMSIKCTF